MDLRDSLLDFEKNRAARTTVAKRERALNHPRTTKDSYIAHERALFAYQSYIKALHGPMESYTNTCGGDILT